ncbi:MAG TPA: glycosyltransferase family 4 protein, partial [Pirellulaceae bacterium]
MRIAWITYDFGEYSLQHVTAMAAEHQVLLVIPRHVLEALTLEVPDGVQTFAFDGPRLRQPLRQFLSIRKIHARVREFQPDVIHLQHGHLWFNLALWRLRSYPLVVTIHDPRHHTGDHVSRKTPQWIMDHGFRRADQVIVHGRNLIPEVERAVGIPRERMHVMPHVAIGEVPAASDPGPPADNQQTLSVLFFGRIWAYKGLDYLIDAEPSVASRIP